MSLVTIIAGATIGILLLGIIGMIDLTTKHYITGVVILFCYLMINK